MAWASSRQHYTDCLVAFNLLPRIVPKNNSTLPIMNDGLLWVVPYMLRE
uniref:Uncharacterized protein n=1 Tax=uncultured marine microorganism HF4000_008B14 TaxID=455512 RepID=B3T137_9ZZZZ|nr:hypothetical protein ALOHA_HF4000008B14ctg1g35 [uncultured marine microorganism HF4000_008B14]